MAFFRVAALDLDGTLTSRGTVSGAALGAIDGARENGLRVLLVTGRIRAELEAEFPGLTDHFDGLVLENGAVAVTGGRARPLALPVDPVLADALDARGVPCRRGEVLLAVDGAHTGVVAEVITDLELDCQIVHNRAAAMVLPAGVTKGTGLTAALADLNLSPHNVVAVGDAENDLSLLEVAEVGVAVGNAVGSVRHRADVVLDESDGVGVAELLSGPYVSGVRRLCPARRWVGIGTFEDGAPARVPGSQARILVTGPSGAGKSFLVGLMAERWVMAGYTVLVVDPEGDHLALEQLNNVRVVDAGEHLPQPVDLLASLTHPLTSVVLDMSRLRDDEKIDYLERLRVAGQAQREQTGLPHWVVMDEAHLPASRQDGEDWHWSPRGGYVLASFLPALIPAAEVESADLVLELRGDETSSGLRLGEPRRATMRVGREDPRPFVVGERRTPHVRHRHKYADLQLPVSRRFYFRVRGEPLVAGTLNEFRTAVRHLDPDVLEFHLQRGDLSRWLDTTIADKDLAAHVAALESDLAARRAADLERIRKQIVRAVSDRYLKEPGRVSG